MKNNGMKLLMITALVALMLSPTQAAAEEGYMSRLSNWWSGVKEKVTTVLGLQAAKPEKQAPVTVASGGNGQLKPVNGSVTSAQSTVHAQPVTAPVTAPVTGTVPAPAAPLKNSAPVASTTSAPAPAAVASSSSPTEKSGWSFWNLFNYFGSRKSDSAPAAQPQDPVAASAGNETEETVYNVAKRELMDVASVQLQPALVPSKRDVEINVSSVPLFTARSRKAVPALAPMAELAAVKARKKYDVDVEVPRAEKLKAVITSQLLPLDTAPLEKINALPSDTLTLIRGLFAWLLNRTDDALGMIHELGLKTQNKPIREKSFAFTGWIISDTGHQGLAALSFWRALAANQASEKESLASFDAAIVAELSQLSRQTGLAKMSLVPSVAESLSTRTSIDAEGRAVLLLLQAERAYDKKAYAHARKLAREVPSKTSLKEHARYLAAVSAFAGSEEASALQTAGRELTELFRTVESSDVFDATAVSLGRIHFILGNYSAAHKYLAQVSRDTNLFIEAAVDNAWALLRSGDRNHAVGNMFTLHTPYFDSAYMPESYFLKSLGYQEICQFGDALNAVKQYKAKYNDAFKKLIEFNAGGKAQEQAYYDDLISYLTRKDTKLSGIVLRELGRHPEFLKRQKELNRIAREEGSLAKALPQSAPKVSAWVKDELASIQATAKKEMARFMKARALEMEEELKFLTANISLLEYEIFAGAGQNLSLQGAQNFAVDEKAVPSRKFEDGKEYWPYEDEIWEDELNNFRSKIVDGCAKVKKAS